MMSNLNEVPNRISTLSDRCWVSCRGGGSASSILFLTLHDCQNNQKLRSFQNPVRSRGRFWLSVFCCSHDDCRVMFPNVFRIQRWS